jgi:hypothetical protein
MNDKKVVEEKKERDSEQVKRVAIKCEKYI